VALKHKELWLAMQVFAVWGGLENGGLKMSISDLTENSEIGPVVETSPKSAWALFEINNSSSGDAVRAGSNSGDGVYGASGRGKGVHGYSSSGEGLYGDSPAGKGVYGKSVSGRGVFGKWYEHNQLHERARNVIMRDSGEVREL